MTSKLKREIRATCIFGIAVIGIFFGGSLVWSVQAPLSGAVIAKGVVGFASKRKTIQHLEGGIIKKILVEEGDHVKVGDTILTLDDTSARARTDELRNKIRTLAAEEARLHAERAGKSEIHFDHPLLDGINDRETLAVLEQQISQFKARAESRRTQRGILVQRVRQLKKQIDGLNIQLKGVRTQLRLIRDEASGVNELYQKGYERKTRLLELLRAEAKLAATEGELIASVARGEEAIGETRIRINDLKTTFLKEVDARLTQVQAERVSSEKIYREWSDRLARTNVYSPIDGIVLDVKFKTIGGVIKPGEPILDIVPSGDELIVNAHVRPTDIDDVVSGSDATIMFSAYHRRYVNRIKGKVIRVSADAFRDDKSGERFFAADVKIDRAHLREAAPDLVLTAGMPAEVFITTADRTLADFLVQPIRRSFERSFREK